MDGLVGIVNGSSGLLLIKFFFFCFFAGRTVLYCILHRTGYTLRSYLALCIMCDGTCVVKRRAKKKHVVFPLCAYQNGQNIYVLSRDTIAICIRLAFFYVSM